MTHIETPQQARQKAKVLHTGRWYIAELDEPQLAVQGESEADARQKLAKRWEEYTAESDHTDIRLGGDDDGSDEPESGLVVSSFWLHTFIAADG